MILKSLETLIDHVGVLYKFHDRPITYLYNTYHFYEATLRDKILLKRKLVSNIIGNRLFCVRGKGDTVALYYIKM